MRFKLRYLIEMILVLGVDEITESRGQNLKESLHFKEETDMNSEDVITRIGRKPGKNSSVKCRSGSCVQCRVQNRCGRALRKAGELSCKDIANAL